MGSRAGAAQPQRASTREFFTVDLRGLRTALSAHAAARGMTESDVLRSALAVALQDAPVVLDDTAPSAADPSPSLPLLKLSSRLSRATAQRLDHHARSAGLSRGAYLTRLIDGAPPVIASTDRTTCAAALGASAAELAVLSRDINRLTQLLRQGAVEAAKQYRDRLDTLDADVRLHLDLAAAVLAAFAPPRTSARQHPLGHRRRSTK